MFQFNTIEEVVQDLRDGKLVIVTDDPDRENEGDLICAAEFATRIQCELHGDLCERSDLYADEHGDVRKARLPQMVADNTDNHATAFTVSIDHVDTTTGISAVERSYTAMKCVEEGVKPEDFRRPGHMFPLEAKAGGVFERGGHTEGTVDLLRIAGLKEAGLCCEIMREERRAMRTKELIEFAQLHNLKFTTIKALKEYRREHNI